MISLLLSIVLCGGPLPDGGVAAEKNGGPVEEKAYARSLAWVRETLERRPADAELHLILGDVHMRQGRYREAIQAFDRASQLNPRDPKPILWKAESHAQLGEQDRAE